MVITPTALTIASGGRHVDDVGGLLLARGVDTLTGCAVALAVLYITGRGYHAARLRTAMTASLAALAALAPHLASGAVTTDGARAARRDAQTRAISLLTAYDAAMESGADARRSAELMWPAVTAAQRLTYRMLAACWQIQSSAAAPPLTREDGRALAAALTGLADANRPDTSPPKASLPAFASGDVTEIRQALSAPER
ncbi:hypothetical protein [Mycolicibacterium chubuense]|uniref:hypothetical protein n=1 Tax=Mycolicibacterium chubuense TaxID=1800 RepID=UPI0002E93096|nr:hypothetical protein [Mycolicibacterium chubuense]